MKEDWKNIIGYEELYQVSNMGRVRSLDMVITMRHRTGKHMSIKRPGRIRSLSLAGQGYLSVMLCNGFEKRFIVSRLVAQHFLDNPNNLQQVNHIDGDKINNVVTNLEWCSPLDNIRHAIRTGLIDPSNHSCRIPVSKLDLNGTHQ